MAQHHPEIGWRVKILGVRKPLGAHYPPGNPQPEHIGKMGTIARWHQVTESMRSVIIHLDDGTEVNGCEYYWWPKGLLPRAIEAIDFS